VSFTCLHAPVPFPVKKLPSLDLDLASGPQNSGVGSMTQSFTERHCVAGAKVSELQEYVLIFWILKYWAADSQLVFNCW
jgi:hypothetical protein